jgi:23S rRNA (uracil1939-C5)-methyltransferase
MPVLRIDKLVHRGLGLARDSSRVWMLPLAAPGDLVEAEGVADRRHWILGRIVRVLEPGPGRIEPVCAEFGRCGGCHLQHIDPAAQVAAKRDVLVETLRRLGRVVIPVPEVVTGSPWAYRCRVELHVRANRVGFFREGSHEVVEAAACPIAHPALSDSIASIRAVVRSIAPAEVELVRGSAPGVVLVVRSGDRQADVRGLAILPGVAGAWAGSRKGRSWTWSCVGLGRIRWKTGPAEYDVDARAFTQANVALNAALVEAVTVLAGAAAGDDVVDLYSGAGNLAFPLAACGARVRAVEAEGEAVESARAAAAGLGMDGITFVRGRVEDRLREIRDRVDVVVADPPREGLGPVARVLAGMACGRLVLVSCEPAALARDLRVLVEGGWRMERLVFVDMFPQTWHIEAVVRLVK